MAVGWKRGGCHKPKNSQKGAVRGVFTVGAVVVSLASPRKASCISYNYCFGYIIRVIVSGQLKMMSLGGGNRGNNCNNNRLSFDNRGL